jgi:CHAT domain-containing protein
MKSGMTKDEALRHAQIDLIHSEKYSNPRDWAAFQLNGDWK